MAQKKTYIFSTTISVLALVFFLAGGGCSETEQPLSEEATTQIQTVLAKPVITTPTNGSTVEGPIVTVIGKATPGYKIMAHNNYTEEDHKCINHNKIPDGSDEADSSGHFEFTLNNACKRTMTVFVSAIPEDADHRECISDENISETITFNISGELHGVCDM